MRENFGHPIVAWRNGMAGLGDDSSTFLSLGFNSLQIQQIQALHASGALSDAGYQALVSGFISPNDLADFLAADPGAPQTSNASVLMPTGGSPTQVNQLAPGPAPRVAIPTSMLSLSTFFTGSSLIAGIPNIVVLGLALLALPMLAGGRKR
jgi:hypothetical protein